MKNNNKKKASEPAAVAVVETGDAATARQLVNQYQVVIAAEKSCFRERVKFGAMLLEWERYLGEARGSHGENDGLKGWLETHCQELSYTAAMNYKAYAQKALAMLGNSASAVAALLGREQVVQPDGETVDVDAAVVEKCDDLFENVTSRRKLEQAWFDFMGDAGGKKKSAAMDRKRKIAQEIAASGDGLTDGDAATRMWMDAMDVFERNRAAFHSAARDLNTGVAKKFLGELEMLVDALRKRLKK